MLHTPVNCAVGKVSETLLSECIWVCACTDAVKTSWRQKVASWVVCSRQWSTIVCRGQWMVSFFSRR